MVAEPGDPPESLTVWISFYDKAGGGNTCPGVTARALTRRRAAGFYERDAVADRPVAPEYLNRIGQTGARLRHCFKWDNAASFRVPVPALQAVRELPFVKEVWLVGSRRRLRYGSAGGPAKARRDDAAGYGTAYTQLSLLRIPQAHRYRLLTNPGSTPGSGVRIAFFDSGFRLDHRCFRHLHQRGAIKATYDFIDNDTSVHDPDSVNNNQSHPYWSNDHHGTEVLSTVAALDTPWYCGAAWGAEFLLARTEDTYYDQSTGTEHEFHTEEDNWAAAVVWAESLGVDIISSSLGYRYDFQDTVIIDRGGVFDTVVDYQKSDLDGRTTIVSRAAQYAVERGIIIVNAVGNERSDGATSLSAPADVDGVIAVGAVTPRGALAPFSSLGPSADGRVKPDLVAPGTSIYLPRVTAPDLPDYSLTGSGTSYAAPLVAGLCALVLQAYPTFSADQLREKIYRHCHFLPSQTAADNAFGRGLPDAIRSSMSDEHEVYIAAVDTAGIPLVNVPVVSSAGDTIGRTSGSGTLRFISDSIPFGLVIRSGQYERHIEMEALPYFTEVFPCSLTVQVLDEKGGPVRSVNIWYRIGSAELLTKSDSLGRATLTSFFPVPVSLRVSKAGYRSSDTLDTCFRELPSSLLVTLKTVENPLFEVYPTVVRRNRSEMLMVRFAPGTGAGTAERRVHASIRSLNGTVVWQSAGITSGGPVCLQWKGSCRGGRRAAPGTYFLLLACDGNHYRKKFIIAE